jgi:hypothetical protein
MQKLVKLNGVQSAASFLLLLDLLSKSTEREYLASEGFNVTPSRSIANDCMLRINIS